MPPTQVRDMTVQKRENDLVLGTFGRGFYVLDDYSAAARGDAGRRSPRRRGCSRCATRYLVQPVGMAPAGTRRHRRDVGQLDRRRIRRSARCSPTRRRQAHPGRHEAGADDQPTTPASRCAGWISTRRRACGASRGTCGPIRRRRRRAARPGGRRRRWARRVRRRAATRRRSSSRVGTAPRSAVSPAKP